MFKMGIAKSFYTEELIRRDTLIEDNKMVKVDTTLLKHTARAILVPVKVAVVKSKAWIPKSQILDPDPIELNAIEPKSELTMIISLWLAKKNSLIYKEVKQNDISKTKS